MAGLSDTARRLTQRWLDLSDPTPALRQITIRGTIRALTDIALRFEFPFVAVCGENGTGKSTILALAACGYHNDSTSGFMPIGIRQRYYTFDDFFILSSLDTKIGAVSIEWRYSGSGFPPYYIVRRSLRWPRYSRRPVRPVQFLGVSRALPARERAFFKSSFARWPLAGLEHADDERRMISRILARPYQRTGRAGTLAHGLHALALPGLRYSGFNMGAGEDSVIALVELVLHVPEGSLILIEEVETGLHPAAQRRLIGELLDIAYSKRIQFIATTHSVDVLESLPPLGRLLLVRKGGRVTAEHGVATSVALAEMRDQFIADAVVYVEDTVAADLLRAALPHRLRRRLRIVPVGSWQSVAWQLASSLKDPGLPPTAALLDGDVHEVEFRRQLARAAGRPLREEDDRWIDLRLLKLPLAGSPESWLTTRLTDPNTIRELGRLLNCTELEAAVIVDSSTIQDTHDMFHVIHMRTGLPHAMVRQLICTAVVSQATDDLGPLLARVDRFLSATLS